MVGINEYVYLRTAAQAHERRAAVAGAVAHATEGLSTMAMKLDQIMMQVFNALAKDYAGMPECDDGNEKQWVAACGRAWKNKVLTDKLFYQYMQQRLADLGDHNLCFLTGPDAGYQPEGCGFTARRFGDELYVTAVGADTRLVPGDAIELINKSTPVAHLGYAIGNPTGSDDPERQDWGFFLTNSSHFMVRHADGSRQDFRTRRFPLAEAMPARPCTFERREDGTCVLTVTQLDNEEAAGLLAARADEARTAPRLVFDLRTCAGGIESMAYPLLNWLFDEDTNLNEVLGAEIVLTNYSAANCARREAQIAQLKNLAAVQGDGTEGLGWLDENLEVVRANRGKGYVEETVEPEDLPLSAGPAGQKVLVLTDSTTADAAEWLAGIAKKAPRATLVGRATMGNLDYSNPLAVAFENRFIFVYPMSKTKAAAEGRGMRGVGIVPDVVVPFTPEECVRDLVMERALAI